MQIQCIEFIGLEVEFSKRAFSQKGVDFAAFCVEVSVVYAEVAEELRFLGLKPEFRVAENDKIVVVGDWLFVGQDFEGAVAPQTHQKSEADFGACAVDGLTAERSDVFPENGLQNHDNVRMFVDVFVRIRFIEGVEAVEQLRLFYGSNVGRQRVQQILSFVHRILVENAPNRKQMVALQALFTKRD